MQLLLQHGVDIEVIDIDGETTATLAVWANHYGIRERNGKSIDYPTILLMLFLKVKLSLALVLFLPITC